MKKYLQFTFLATVALVFSLIALPSNNVLAAFEDGTYQINYEVKEDGSNNTSIADGYFKKPAKLTVQNGVQTVQITLKESDMIKSLSVGGSPVDVVSDSDNKRVVKFTAKDLSKVNMDMHIVVPDLYEREHRAQAVFNTKDIPAKKSEKDAGKKEPQKKSEKPSGNTSDNNDSDNNTAAVENDNNTPNKDDNATSANETNEEVVNPPTGDDTPIALYIGLLVASVVGFALFKFRYARN